MFALALPYLIKWGIPFIIGGMLAGGAAWKIQGMRLDSCKSTATACLSANVENDKTIKALQADVDKADKTCQQRLASKDATIRKLKEIDDLRGRDETNPDSGNPLRDAVNGMWRDNKGTVR